jgi:hypothetical protein
MTKRDEERWSPFISSGTGTMMNHFMLFCGECGIIILHFSQSGIIEGAGKR